MTTLTRIKIPYRPRNWAREVHELVRSGVAAAKPLFGSKLIRPPRWAVLVLHRRAGKTTAAFNHLQRDALNNPGTRYAYIAPTYKQAKRIVWGMAKHYSENIPGIKYNESELLITYANGSEIMILGANQPDSLRGIALWGCFLDEYSQMSPLLFTEIISKCLADHLGYCIFGGTPKGKGHFYRIYQVALKNPEDWVLAYKTIDQSLEEESGPTIDALRIALEDDRKLVKQGLMTEDEFQQEWYCSFEAAIKGAVYLKQLAEMRKTKGRICRALYDPLLPVYTVWDLGISKSDAMAVGFFQTVGKEVRWIDYLETLQIGLPGTIEQVLKKKYTYAKHFAPHDIKHKEVGTGKTRLTTSEALGISFQVVPKIGLDDGIDQARAFLTRLIVDPDTCETGLDFLGQYHYEYDEKRGMFTKNPVHDFTSHCADMIRYAAVICDEMEPDYLAQPVNSKRADEDDEYMGHEDPAEETADGFGKSPTMKGINIGLLGHKK